MGSVDIGLNAEGERQAALARDQLADMHFDAILTSPLKRSKKTAELIAERHPDTPLIVAEVLRERNFGSYEGKPNNGDYYGLWQYDNDDTPGGETPKDLEKRIYPFLDHIHEKYAGNVLIVGHGGIGLIIKSYYHGTPKYGDLLEYAVGNGVLEKFEYASA
jgi:broad specificity phosphatase PhoE